MNAACMCARGEGPHEDRAYTLVNRSVSLVVQFNLWQSGKAFTSMVLLHMYKYHWEEDMVNVTIQLVLDEEMEAQEDSVGLRKVVD